MCHGLLRGFEPPLTDWCTFPFWCDVQGGRECQLAPFVGIVGFERWRTDVFSFEQPLSREFKSLTPLLIFEPRPRRNCRVKVCLMPQTGRCLWSRCQKIPPDALQMRTPDGDPGKSRKRIDQTVDPQTTAGKTGRFRRTPPKFRRKKGKGREGKKQKLSRGHPYSSEIQVARRVPTFQELPRRQSCFSGCPPYEHTLPEKLQGHGTYLTSLEGGQLTFGTTDKYDMIFFSWLTMTQF